MEESGFKIKTLIEETDEEAILEMVITPTGNLLVRTTKRIALVEIESGKG